MKPGRNEPCTCGSGKKYKHCCGLTAQEKMGRWSAYGMLLVGAVVIIGLMEFFIARSEEKPATDGRTWSAEHGHWHDANGREIGSGAGGGAVGGGGGAAQPPPGPAPAGKVWSVEHGHWHDA